MSQPLKVLITGAAGQIGYCLVGAIAAGTVFGVKQSLLLHLLEIPAMVPNLTGVVMELEDCNFPLLKGIVATGDPKEAFTDIDFAIMLGSMPRKEGMERRDLLKGNVTIFKAQGEFLNQFAKKTVKVCVVGNPANTNCFIMSKFAPTIPKENFTALTRLDHNRAQSQIAMKAGVSYGDVKKVVIWGNHSGTQFPDVSNGLVKMKTGKEVPVKEAIKDEKWLTEDFIKLIQTRGAAVIAARKLSSAMSAAKAICDHCHDWFNGTKEWVSMAVYSDGSYGAPKDVIFSFPVTVSGGKWSIVKGLKIDDFAMKKIDATGKELEEEKNDAITTCA